MIDKILYLTKAKKFYTATCLQFKVVDQIFNSKKGEGETKNMYLQFYCWTQTFRDSTQNFAIHNLTNDCLLLPHTSRQCPGSGMENVLVRKSYAATKEICPTG